MSHEPASGSDSAVDARERDTPGRVAAERSPVEAASVAETVAESRSAGNDRADRILRQLGAPKLNVHGRRQAVAKARTLGYLSD